MKPIITHSQIELHKKSPRMIYTVASKGHYKSLMKRGLCFPTTKQQAAYFIKNKCETSVLSCKDTDLIEALLNKHGLFGEYVYTKYQNWVRLNNHEALYTALKIEYKLLTPNDHTAIVTVLNTGFVYAYAFVAGSRKEADDFADWKFDANTTSVAVKKGAWTVRNGKAEKIKDI